MVAVFSQVEQDIEPFIFYKIRKRNHMIFIVMVSNTNMDINIGDLFRVGDHIVQ